MIINQKIHTLFLSALLAAFYVADLCPNGYLVGSYGISGRKVHKKEFFLDDAQKQPLLWKFHKKSQEHIEGPKSPTSIFGQDYFILKESQGRDQGVVAFSDGTGPEGHNAADQITHYVSEKIITEPSSQEIRKVILGTSKHMSEAQKKHNKSGSYGNGTLLLLRVSPQKIIGGCYGDSRLLMGKDKPVHLHEQKGAFFGSGQDGEKEVNDSWLDLQEFGGLNKGEFVILMSDGVHEAFQLLGDEAYKENARKKAEEEKILVPLRMVHYQRKLTNQAIAFAKEQIDKVEGEKIKEILRGVVANKSIGEFSGEQRDLAKEHIDKILREQEDRNQVIRLNVAAINSDASMNAVIEFVSKQLRQVKELTQQAVAGIAKELVEEARSCNDMTERNAAHDDLTAIVIASDPSPESIEKRGIFGLEEIKKKSDKAKSYIQSLLTKLSTKSFSDEKDKYMAYERLVYLVTDNGDLLLSEKQDLMKQVLDTCTFDFTKVTLDALLETGRDFDASKKQPFEEQSDEPAPTNPNPTEPNPANTGEKPAHKPPTPPAGTQSTKPIDEPLSDTPQNPPQSFMRQHALALGSAAVFTTVLAAKFGPKIKKWIQKRWFSSHQKPQATALSELHEQYQSGKISHEEYMGQKAELLNQE